MLPDSLALCYLWLGYLCPPSANWWLVWASQWPCRAKWRGYSGSHPGQTDETRSLGALRAEKNKQTTLCVRQQTTDAAAQDRLERDLNGLKRMNHTNINIKTKTILKLSFSVLTLNCELHVAVGGASGVPGCARVAAWVTEFCWGDFYSTCTHVIII